jgi:hypothetical protein
MTRPQKTAGQDKAREALHNWNSIRRSFEACPPDAGKLQEYIPVSKGDRGNMTRSFEAFKFKPSGLFRPF